jgi:hypothetical protein
MADQCRTILLPSTLAHITYVMHLEVIYGVIYNVMFVHLISGVSMQLIRCSFSTVLGLYVVTLLEITVVKLF